MTAKWQGQPKLWRVRGKSTDGMIVTLGNHDTETAAKADAEKFEKGKFYREVKVEPIPQAEAPDQAVE